METYNFSNIGYKSLLDNVYFYIQKVEFHCRNFLLLDSQEKSTFIREKAKVAKGRKKVWLGMIRSKIGHKTTQEHEETSMLFELWNNNDRAAVNYVPKVYSGRVALFVPIRKYTHHARPGLGWDNIVTGGLETYQLPVYPAGMLVKPFVHLLAEKMKICIDKALTST
jgi:hypothetical protein